MTAGWRRRHPAVVSKKGETVDLKRWLMALALAALFAAPIGSSTTAFAAGTGMAAPAGPAYHDHPADDGEEEGEGEGEGEGDEGGGGGEGGGGLPGLISAILAALSGGEGGD
jgi:hypothetical protein